MNMLFDRTICVQPALYQDLLYAPDGRNYFKLAVGTCDDNMIELIANTLMDIKNVTLISNEIGPYLTSIHAPEVCNRAKTYLLQFMREGLRQFQFKTTGMDFCDLVEAQLNANNLLTVLTAKLDSLAKFLPPYVDNLLPEGYYESATIYAAAVLRAATELSKCIGDIDPTKRVLSAGGNSV